MPATVHIWTDGPPPPPAPYVDANFILLLRKAREAGTSGADERSDAAAALHRDMAAAGSELWTTPLALQEAVWRTVVQRVSEDRREAGGGQIPLSALKRRDKGEYLVALRRALPYGADLIAFVRGATAISIRWPLTADGRAVPADLVAQAAEFLMRNYDVEPADAVHDSLAWWDFLNAGNCILSDDRGLQQVDELTVYAYAPA